MLNKYDESIIERLYNYGIIIQSLNFKEDSIFGDDYYVYEVEKYIKENLPNVTFVIGEDYDYILQYPLNNDKNNDENSAFKNKVWDLLKPYLEDDYEQFVSQFKTFEFGIVEFTN